MAITRRQTLLTLARLEWNLVVHQLEVSPSTPDSVAPALANLRQKLRDNPSDLDELVTISQPPLDWSPVILALSLNVLENPSLLPLAERLREQMSSQAKRVELPLTPEEMASGLRNLPLYPDDLAHRLTANN